MSTCYLFGICVFSSSNSRRKTEVIVGMPFGVSSQHVSKDKFIDFRVCHRESDTWKQTVLHVFGFFFKSIYVCFMSWYSKLQDCILTHLSVELGRCWCWASAFPTLGHAVNNLFWQDFLHLVKCVTPRKTWCEAKPKTWSSFSCHF